MDNSGGLNISILAGVETIDNYPIRGLPDAGERFGRARAGMGLYSHVSPPSPGGSAPSDASSNEVVYLLVAEATGLSRIGDRSPNVCVTVSLGETTARTKTRKESTFPLWNELLTVAAPSFPAIANVSLLDVESGPDEPAQRRGSDVSLLSETVLGSCEVPILSELKNGFTDLWYSLKGETGETLVGKVRIAASFDTEVIEQLRKGLTPSLSRQIYVAQETWFIIEPDLEEVGVQFFRNVFAVDEELKQKFGLISDGDDSAEAFRTPALKKHAAIVLKTIGRAVAGLNDVSTLMPLFESLGRSHAKRGVKPEHLEVFLQALLWALEDHLNQKWNDEIRESWQAVFETVLLL